ncbi:hypothetical protein CNR22_11695 [Sphingobacteriaceae bacterium]|nr:hypothetical protein CNR22_11695 [Sphingobacteriaceae bacterium]
MDVFKSIVVISFFCSTLLSCDEPKSNFETRLENLKVHKSEEDKMFKFAVPDSIPALLVAAVYYEHHISAHGVIVYADSNKKEAVNYFFFPDSTVQSDKIVSVKFNEFKSATTDVHYIVKQKSVARIVQSGALSYSSENARIDNGNTYESWVHQNTNTP